MDTRLESSLAKMLQADGSWAHMCLGLHEKDGLEWMEDDPNDFSLGLPEGILTGFLRETMDHYCLCVSAIFQCTISQLLSQALYM